MRNVHVGSSGHGVTLSRSSSRFHERGFPLPVALSTVVFTAGSAVVRPASRSAVFCTPRRATEGSLSKVKRTAVAAALSAVLFRCQLERGEGRMRATIRARRKRTLHSPSVGGDDSAAICDAVLRVCYTMGCGAFPRATTRWWMKRRTGGTWEDLRLCDDTTTDYFREKLRISPRVFREITEALSPFLERRKAVVLRAFTDKGFPNCDGCIDCTHISIDKPANCPGEDYYDRKRHFSVQAQVVVDLNLCMLDVFVGYPGSCHDVRIVHVSSLWARAEAGELFTGPPVMLPFGVWTNGYLLGDNGYPPSEWVVVPYGGVSQDPVEMRFNNKQKTARGAVERAFERLKGMWRLFLRSHKTNMETLPQQFVAVNMFHDILIDASIPFDDNLLWEVGPDDVRRRVDLGMDRPLRQMCMDSSTGDALILRDTLAERMAAQ
ncbi:hypothetical protein CBR_g25794 [Chara braunii]|uniref:DDE Tnp4 domain-containing protein n=1 Tax=Chara braunii TaxID=69332 RepID=A0A388L6J6_CHABU|nr:hypothetical protein CBR_g25794 [Chara braunii]|eukprot:GBG77862.1 hypothetical protein CBR_g25794 [Chara braunii]